MTNNLILIASMKSKTDTSIFIPFLTHGFFVVGQTNYNLARCKLNGSGGQNGSAQSRHGAS